MNKDSQDESARGEVFKEIILKFQSVINSEIARSAPTPMEGVTIGQAQAEPDWEAQGDWGQGNWGSSCEVFEP